MQFFTIGIAKEHGTEISEMTTLKDNFRVSTIIEVASAMNVLLKVLVFSPPTG